MAPKAPHRSRVMCALNQKQAIQGNFHTAEYVVLTQGGLLDGDTTVTARRGTIPVSTLDKSGKPERHTGSLRLAQITKKELITY